MKHGRRRDTERGGRRGRGFRAYRQLRTPDNAATADTRAGWLSAQRVRCGRPGCKCSRGELHGPYFYLFWREGRKLKKRYVRRADVAAVRERCERAAASRQAAREAGKPGQDYFVRSLSKALKWL